MLEKGKRYEKAGVGSFNTELLDGSYDGRRGGAYLRGSDPPFLFPSFPLPAGQSPDSNDSEKSKIEKYNYKPTNMIKRTGSVDSFPTPSPKKKTGTKPQDPRKKKKKNLMKRKIPGLV